MKNFYYSFLTVAVVAFSSCSAEDAIADAQTANDTDKVLQQRMKIIMAMDFTTLFTYSNAAEAKSKFPHAVDSLVNIQKLTMHAHKNSTEAIIKIVLENGKAIIWEKHFIDAPNKRLVELIRKKEDSHIMYIGTRDNYPALYKKITETIKNSHDIGTFTYPETTAAANEYLTAKLSNGSAEFHIKITADSAEIYAGG